MIGPSTLPLPAITREAFQKLNSGKTLCHKVGDCTVIKARGNFVFHAPTGRHEMAGVQDYARVSAHFRVFCLAGIEKKATGS